MKITLFSRNKGKGLEEYKKDGDEVFNKGLYGLCSMFDKSCKSKVTECLNNGLFLLMHGLDQQQFIIPVCMASFVITIDGAYINYIATNSAKFCRPPWEYGDNKAYQGRGLATLFLLIILSSWKNYHIIFQILFRELYIFKH